MPIDELRHSLSDASAAVEALSRRLEGRLDPGEDQLLEHVRTTMRRFEEVIDALIAYELAAEPVDLRPVDLDDVVATAVETHAHELQATDEVHIAELPTVEGDEALLLALFRPLVENAIKYRHAERPLALRIRAEPHGRSTWRVVVEDNGVGIAPAQADRIFEMFERDEPGRSPGQGLGLAAARRIAEAHEGSISAVPLDEGTAVHVLLPRRP